jgi:hypothetical protein
VRLARSGGGILDVSETLNGGDIIPGRAPQEIEIYSQVFYNERVKLQADAAIQAENIATRGEKLAKRKDMTRAMYATEDDSVKVQVKAKHQEALANWKQKRDLTKAGIVHEVDRDSKIR